MLLYRLGRGYMLSTSIAMRTTQFEQLPPPTGRLVFLGDSITEGGLWDEWFREAEPVNRGIGGNTIGDVLDRLDTAIANPAAVFLLVGTNDLGLGHSAGQVAADMRRLVTAIRDRTPTAPLFVQSVMPRRARFAARIRELNDAYRDIAAQADAIYIDLWPALTDGNGELRSEFTRDGLHLSGRGYAVWVEVLRPYIKALALRREPGVPHE
ncbi:GDSL-type esterase/lipase family protein [Nocardia tengchongensis]|uniref:GDSL-type esterase/lipase family protein n=1 Tax=Nocardia tengchongensis TaxID=2055889 RepID=UPI003655E904